jgi:hypothetical protein
MDIPEAMLSSAVMALQSSPARPPWLLGLLDESGPSRGSFLAIGRPNPPLRPMCFEPRVAKPGTTARRFSATEP